MNKILLVGRLTKDPEYRQSTNGTSMCSFTVAVNRNFKNANGTYDADFLPCVTYRQTADFVNRFFKKGNMIGVEGRVQTRSYDAQDGTKRYVTEVVVDNAEFVNSKSENSSSDSSSNQTNYSNDVIDSPSVPDIDVSSPVSYESNDEGNILSDNDLPF